VVDAVVLARVVEEVAEVITWLVVEWEVVEWEVEEEVDVTLVCEVECVVERVVW